MKSHLSVLFSIMLAIITACTPQPQCKVKSEIAKHFRMDVFDSLHIGSEYIEPYYMFADFLSGII